MLNVFTLRLLKMLVMKMSIRQLLDLESAVKKTGSWLSTKELYLHCTLRVTLARFGVINAGCLASQV